MIYSGARIDASSIVNGLPTSSESVIFTIDGEAIDKNKCASVRLGKNGYANVVNGFEPRIDKYGKRILYKRIRGHVEMHIL